MVDPRERRTLLIPTCLRCWRSDRTVALSGSKIAEHTDTRHFHLEN
jgi:hypothetical protein